MSKFARIKVLILDKNPEFHDVVSKAVAGIQLTNLRCCASVEDALQLLNGEWLPDLIIMEIDMGGAVGLNFLSQIRAGKTPADENLPIVIMTRNIEPATAFRACEIGFEHFIRKPFDDEALQKRVVSVLEKPRRFVISKGFFGPSRRNPSNVTNYQGEERRGANGRPTIKEAPPPKVVKAPNHIETGGKSSLNGAVIDDGPEVPDTVSEIDSAMAAAVSDETREQLKAAPKPAPVKPLKPKAQKEAEPEKEKIELVAAPKERDDGGNPDRAAEIAAKLESHAEWLQTHGAKGEKADFADQDLSGADLSEANLSNANLRSADLQDANLARANLFDADLRSANLSGANLGEADIHNANLRHANLKSAQMQEAELRAADLSGANLEGAQMAGVDFKDVNFLSTNIQGADLQGANLTQKQIDKAIGDASTLLPPGIRIKIDEAE
mgnify:FL=1